MNLLDKPTKETEKTRVGSQERLLVELIKPYTQKKQTLKVLIQWLSQRPSGCKNAGAALLRSDPCLRNFLE